MRAKLTLAYHGARFHGSQVQAHTANTVMGVLAAALQRLGIESTPVASGRTDTGVHAFRQVVHVDLPAHWNDLAKLTQALQRQLPDSIAVRRLEAVDEDFHARFSARRRVYRYIMHAGPSNPFEAELVTFTPPLDLKKINAAMRCYEGEHDFEYFMKTGSNVHHCVRSVYRAFAYTHKNYTILYFEANGFLRSQIRMMADAVLKINGGVMSLQQLQAQRDKQRRHCTDLAPAAGLYLSKIIY